jgi:hypothetical protein
MLCGVLADTATGRPTSKNGALVSGSILKKSSANPPANGLTDFWPNGYGL